MATYQQLQDDVSDWLNRRDIGSRIPGWVAMVETEIAETLRARCQVKSGLQAINAAYINLPPDFATMESIRDATTGEMLELKDEWSGHWTTGFKTAGFDTVSQPAPGAPCTAYRLVEDCIEFLPHPVIPPGVDDCHLQQVRMAWYARPAPLLLPADTNVVLENLYSVYFFGVCKYGAMRELDNDRVAQADAAWQQAVTRANLHKQQSDYSGAPFRSELATVF